MFNARLEKKIVRSAAKNLQTIALPEAAICERVVRAGVIANKKRIVNVVLIGNEDKIKADYPKLDFNGISFIDNENYKDSERLAKKLYTIRKEKGMKQREAKELVKDPIYFATMLLEDDEVDGIVGGAVTSSADMLRPALQIIKGKKGVKKISSSFIMSGGRWFKVGCKGTSVFSDCALNIEPTAKEVKDIAFASIDTALSLAKIKQPRVAMLSYSTYGSGKGKDVTKMEKATKLLNDDLEKEMVENINSKYKDVAVGGELQMDAAISQKIAKIKCDGKWAGKANVFVFPNLSSANIAYKTTQIVGKIRAIGPIMQGFTKPVNDLSRGASVEEIVLSMAITASQAATNKSEEKELVRQQQLAKEEKVKQKELAELEAKLKKEEEARIKAEEKAAAALKAEKQEKTKSENKKEDK